jgi:hypothetical protein
LWQEKPAQLGGGYIGRQRQSPTIGPQSRWCWINLVKYLVAIFVAAVARPHRAEKSIMKRKKKEVRPMERGYISGSELSLEIEQAEELLPTSCHWAVNLTEGIQHFGDSFFPHSK